MIANVTLMYLVEFLPQVQDRRQLGGPLFLVKLARFKIGSHQNFELANHLTTHKITVTLINNSSNLNSGSHDRKSVWIPDLN